MKASDWMIKKFKIVDLYDLSPMQWLGFIDDFADYKNQILENENLQLKIKIKEIESEIIVLKSNKN